MSSINERMTALESLTTENNKTLWRIHEAIYGNGKPGLLAPRSGCSPRASNSITPNTASGKSTGSGW